MRNLREHQWLSAAEARRVADRAVFGDLVGCALASGDPLWVSAPEPHWRIPYRSFDGTVLIAVDVDARIPRSGADPRAGLRAACRVSIEVMRLTARVPFASLPVRMGGGAVAGYERWQQLLEVEGAAVYQAAVCTP